MIWNRRVRVLNLRWNQKVPAWTYLRFLTISMCRRMLIQRRFHVRALPGPPGIGTPIHTRALTQIAIRAGGENAAARDA